MRAAPRGVAPWPAEVPPLWCCSYCSAPLERQDHGLLCRREGRFFSTERGVHRLLPAERRREILPFLELYQRVRRDEGWVAEPGLPEVRPGHPKEGIWRERAERFRRGLALVSAALGEGPWRVLDVGAGCCWMGARLAGLGHRVFAVDLNLDPDDGLPAAERLAPLGALPERAEADMEALPLAAGAFDLVLAGGALHYAAHLERTLVELRRVTRRGGVLLVLDSPAYRRRPDGEAMVEERMRRHARRYHVSLPREAQSSYLALGELPGAFREAGFKLEIHGWPNPVRETLRDALEIARRGRRTARFPILLGRRDG